VNQIFLSFWILLVDRSVSEVTEITKLSSESTSLDFVGNGKDKGKGHPRTDHEGPEGEKMYSFTLPSTSALDGGGGQRHAPAALLPGKTRYPLYRRLSGP